MAMVSSSIWRMAPLDRLPWRGSRWKLEPEPALNLQTWDADKQWEFDQKCELAIARIPRQDCLCLLGTPQTGVPSPSKEPHGNGAEEAGEQRQCCSKLSIFISLSWFKGGNIENPQSPNKPTLILLGGCTAVGGLLQHRWDGADLPPAPVNSSSQDASPKPPVRQDSALEHAEAGESRFWGSVQAGVGWQLHPRVRLWGQPGRAQAELDHGHCPSLLEMFRLVRCTWGSNKAGFPLQLALESCRDGLNSCMDFMPMGTAFLHGQTWAGGCWGCSMRCRDAPCK